MDKLKNIEFIKDFSKITVKKACEEEHVQRGDLYTLRASSEKIQRIKDNIRLRLKELESKYDSKDNTL